MTPYELLREREDGSMEDMCTNCLNIVHDNYGVYDLSWVKDRYDTPETLKGKLTISDSDFFDIES